ncbi:anti-sigma factor [Geodermatophilus marinus]|uniref:anti-sigma factor n=1 Tax=Geodermatophilus sp. LHW52908 TaxID=2303986 RepID=UPI000E3DC5E1|nr:anti-sigma factor [Geodermatophilus sp. LHW52908]RFU22647.1 zf-HC2 domain-containing protein [Geodermatophilus sp. LHW52908]
MTGAPGTAHRAGGHEEYDELAVGWALHALEPEDEDRFGLHLPGCPRCRETVTEATEVMASLSADLPQARPSEALRTRLRAAVEETGQLTPPPVAAPSSPSPSPPSPSPPSHPAMREVPPEPDEPRPPEDPPAATGFPGYLPAPLPAGSPRPAAPTPWRRVLPNALAAVAVAALLALGTWIVVLSTARDDARAAAARQAAVVDQLLVPGEATIASLSDDDGGPLATVVARPDRVQVVTHGLRVNDEAAQTYVVWGMGAGDPRPLGTFDVVTPRMDLHTLGSASTGLDAFPEYGISLEPGRQAPSDPTEIVATGQVTS